MFCHECGTQVEDDQKFCTNCGSRMDAGMTQQPNTAAQSHGSTLPATVFAPSSKSYVAANPEVMSGAQENQSSASAEDTNVRAVQERQRGQSSSWNLRPILLWGGLVAIMVVALIAVLMLRRGSGTPAIVTDEEIIKSIRSGFSADPNLSKCSVEIKSRQGTVTLTGLVKTNSDKVTAARIASQQLGVKEVNVFGLTVDGSLGSERSKSSSISSKSSDQPSSPGEEAGSKGTTTVAPYIFEGAYASYTIHYGALSIPLQIKISNVDPATRYFWVWSTFGDPLAFHSGKVILGFDQAINELMPSKFMKALREGTFPPHYDEPGARVLNHVTVVVPAGSFLTEELAYGQGSFSYDTYSGLLVKMQGPGFVAQFESDLPKIPRPNTFSLELVSTNVPHGP